MKKLMIQEIKKVDGGHTCCKSAGSKGDAFVKARGIVGSMPPYVYVAAIGCIYTNSSYSFKGSMDMSDKWKDCTTPTSDMVQCYCYVLPCCSK